MGASKRWTARWKSSGAHQAVDNQPRNKVRLLWREQLRRIRPDRWGIGGYCSDRCRRQRNQTTGWRLTSPTRTVTRT